MGHVWMTQSGAKAQGRSRRRLQLPGGEGEGRWGGWVGCREGGHYTKGPCLGGHALWLVQGMGLARTPAIAGLLHTQPTTTPRHAML